MNGKTEFTCYCKHLQINSVRHTLLSSLMPSPQGLVTIGQILTYLEFVDFVARPAGAVIMLKDGDQGENALYSCVFLLQQSFHFQSRCDFFYFFVPSIHVAPAKSALLSMARDRLAPVRLASERLAPVRLASEILARVRSASYRSVRAR